VSCLFAILNLCMFDPSGVALSGRLSWQVSGDMQYRYSGQRYTGSIGHLSLQVTVPWTRSIELGYGIEHRSYAEIAGDRGDESAFVGFVWRPFH
jgi:hypothetical protein